MAFALFSTSFPAASAPAGAPRRASAPAVGRVLAAPARRFHATAALPAPAAGSAGREPAGVPAVPLALAAVLLALAVLIAPEQPRDQEAICHRQAGVEACRVW